MRACAPRCRFVHVCIRMRTHAHIRSRVRTYARVMSVHVGYAPTQEGGSSKPHESALWTTGHRALSTRPPRFNTMPCRPMPLLVHSRQAHEVRIRTRGSQRIFSTTPPSSCCPCLRIVRYEQTAETRFSFFQFEQKHDFNKANVHILCRGGIIFLLIVRGSTNK